MKKYMYYFLLLSAISAQLFAAQPKVKWLDLSTGNKVAYIMEGNELRYVDSNQNPIITLPQGLFNFSGSRGVWTANGTGRPVRRFDLSEKSNIYKSSTGLTFDESKQTFKDPSLDAKRAREYIESELSQRRAQAPDVWEFQPKETPQEKEAREEREAAPKRAARTAFLQAEMKKMMDQEAKKRSSASTSGDQQAAARAAASSISAAQQAEQARLAQQSAHERASLDLQRQMQRLNVSNSPQGGMAAYEQMRAGAAAASRSAGYASPSTKSMSLVPEYSASSFVEHGGSAATAGSTYSSSRAGAPLTSSMTTRVTDRPGSYENFSTALRKYQQPKSNYKYGQASLDTVSMFAKNVISEYDSLSLDDQQKAREAITEASSNWEYLFPTIDVIRQDASMPAKQMVMGNVPHGASVAFARSSDTGPVEISQELTAAWYDYKAAKASQGFLPNYPVRNEADRVLKAYDKLSGEAKKNKEWLTSRGTIQGFPDHKFDEALNFIRKDAGIASTAASTGSAKQMVMGNVPHWGSSAAAISSRPASIEDFSREIEKYRGSRVLEEFNQSPLVSSKTHAQTLRSIYNNLSAADKTTANNIIRGSLSNAGLSTTIHNMDALLKDAGMPALAAAQSAQTITSAMPAKQMVMGNVPHSGSSAGASSASLSPSSIDEFNKVSLSYLESRHMSNPDRQQRIARELINIFDRLPLSQRNEAIGSLDRGARVMGFIPLATIEDIRKEVGR